MKPLRVLKAAFRLTLRLVLALFATVLLVVSLAVTASLTSPKRNPLLTSADIEQLSLPCDSTEGPEGTGMPAWPEEGLSRSYTKQTWQPDGTLVVEVWRFLSPGYQLVGLEKHVRGGTITVAPDWEAGTMVAACFEKMGVRATFHGLPRRQYEIDTFGPLLPGVWQALAKFGTAVIQLTGR